VPIVGVILATMANYWVDLPLSGTLTPRFHPVTARHVQWIFADPVGLEYLVQGSDALAALTQEPHPLAEPS
jgi:hypothetical protein